MISRSTTRVAHLALVATLLLCCAAPGVAADVTGAQVRQAVRKGVRALQELQSANGAWPERHQPGGETCLAALALLHAGESPKSGSVAAAVLRIRELPNQHVYVTSLKTMVLAQVDPQKYRREIQDAAQWLERAQGPTGLWNYTPDTSRFDHSNSQFALLGLHAAAQAGIKIPANVWKNALAGIAATQNEDGGWSYQGKGDSYGSMTAAGVSDLLIVGSQRYAGSERGFRDGKAAGCGRYRTNKPLDAGLEWLSRRFTASGNPGRRESHVLYWLYAVERCGILSGQRYFGRHDWYREGARYLVRAQHADGSWGSALEETCFAILFLAKGHKSLLIQKLQWSDDDAWNPDHYDAAHLISFIGDKLGEPVEWQVVRFDAPLEEWLAAPLLYMQGHTFPTWNEQQRAKVRAFIEQGGTLLAEACCGRREFRIGFEQFAAETFPEFPLRELGREHAVYHVHYNCPTYGLKGIDIGCRTSVIYSPKDMSCLWEQGDIPKLSERAFELGTNIAAYAMGRRPLIDRLDAVVLPAKPTADARPPTRDALRLAQVVYESDWRPFPTALVHLTEFLRRQANLDVITQYRQIRLTDPELYTCPILYMAGHYDFELSEAEQAALVAHLRRGGFLLVDNCCGPEPFDTAFRRMIAQAFQDTALERLPQDHPIFRGQPGFDVQTVHYGPDVLRATPELSEPELWGLEVEGRLALVYSPYALGCGLEGQEFEGCWGLVAEDARRLAANIVLYALSH